MIFLFDVIEKIRNYKEDVIVLASGQTRERLLRELSHKHIVPSFSIRDFSCFDFVFSDHYLYHMKKECSIDFGLADALRPFFAYSDRFQLLPKEKAELLESSFSSLKVNRLVHPPQFRPFNRIVSLNRGVFLPAHLNDQTVTLYSGSRRTSVLPVFGCCDKAEEIGAVYQQILLWLKKGIHPDQIRVVNASEMDDYQLNRWLKDAGIPFSSIKQRPLRKFPQAIQLLALLEKPMTADEVTDFLLRLKTIHPQEVLVKKTILQLINRHSLSVLLQHRDLFSYCLKNASVAPINYQGAIQSLPLSELYPDDELYYLILNSHDSALPVKKIDGDYLSDQDKMKLGSETSVEYNLRMESQLANILSRLKNVVLFYAKKEAGSDNHFPKLVVDCEIQEQLINPDHNRLYASFEMDRLTYAKMRYDQKTYGIVHPDFPHYSATFSNRLMQSDFQFTGLSQSTIAKICSRGIVLSATNLERFHSCPFQYLVTDILKVGAKEASLPLFFGNIAHEILKNKRTVDLKTLDELSQLFSRNYPPDFAMRKPLFLRAFLEQIKTTLNYLEEYDRQSRFAIYASESEFSYPYPGGNIRIKGKIDQIRTWQQDDEIRVIVIDFKTGNKQFGEEDFLQGMDIQLPFYLHLIKANGKTRAFIPCGFYYQRLLPGHYAHNKKEDPIKKQLALNGKTLNDPVVFSALGGDENWIKRCKKKSDGTLKASKQVIQADELVAMIDHIDKLIEDAVNGIKVGFYPIKPVPPLPNQTLSLSCQYCPYMGVCHLPLSRNDSDEAIDEEVDLSNE